MNIRSKKLRINVSEESILKAIALLDKHKATDLAKEFKEALATTKEQNAKRVNDTKKAVETKSEKTKLKVEKAIKMLRLEGKPINAYQISKKGTVAVKTAKKYLDLLSGLHN